MRRDLKSCSTRIQDPRNTSNRRTGTASVQVLLIDIDEHVVDPATRSDFIFYFLPGVPGM